MTALQAMPVDAEADVVAGVLGLLRADAGVREVFGNPARVFDQETEAPAFPFVRLERVETRDAGASCVPALDHRITLAIASRWGGRAQAKLGLGHVRHALETQDISVPGQAIVLQQVIYSDVLRAADRRAFRGILQLRIVAEEVSP